MENDKDKNAFVFSEAIINNNEDIKDKTKWKILIADDDSDVHTLTKMVLKKFTFENIKLEFLHAYSGEETQKIVKEQPDIALVLLDVVMETEDAGLRTVKYIREDLENRFLRIILRTGQPGQAPEKDVITKYDINDYKEKTELTAQKLMTSIISSLRTYRDLRTIEKNRIGLEKIIHASTNLFDTHSFNEFATGLLTQLISILQLDENSVYLYSAGFTLTKDKGKFKVVAATGIFEEYVGKSFDDIEKPDQLDFYNNVKQAIENKKSLLNNNVYVGYFETKEKTINLVYLRGKKALDALDKQLINIFSTNVSIAFDNIHLYEKWKNNNQKLKKEIKSLKEENIILKNKLEKYKN